MSMRSLDEVDGFDDFESEVSSSEETMAVQRTHSQSQQKNIKSGKFGEPWETFMAILTHGESQFTLCSNDLISLGLTIEIFFLVHSTLRDCCARFLCSWVMYECDDIAISSADPHPNEVKERLVEFLRSEVRFSVKI